MLSLLQSSEFGWKVTVAMEMTGQLRELDQMLTLVAAGVCAVIIIIPIVLEKVLHKFGDVSACCVSFCRLKVIRILVFVFYCFEMKFGSLFYEIKAKA